MPKDEIKFDELDNKFFEEFPLIVDVFASTVNKINQFLIPYHEELLLFVEQEISNHKGWSISEKGTYSKRQIPFTNESRRKFSLEQDLVARYETSNCISIVKMDEKKVVNYFNLVSGFYFEPKRKSIVVY